MTTRRNARETFEVDWAELAERVREVLAQDQIYRDTVERDDGSLFETNVKPSFLFLDTGMHIALERNERSASPRMVVSVATVSQGRADPLGLSSGFINRFLRALRRRVEEPAENRRP